MAKTQIRVVTEITRYTKKKGHNCFGLGVGDVKLTEGQRNKLDGLIDDAAKVKLTIEPEQENLPYKEE